MRLDELEADNSIKAKLFTSQTRNAPFGLGITPRAFNFHDANGDVGVPIDGSIRLGILISRLGDNSDSAVAAIHGTEVSAGPRESYDDASTDFDLENDVVYEHINPGVGQSTHSHGTDIRGNIKIFYTVIIDHGNLVGDGKINAAHINSGSAAVTDFLGADGAGAAVWKAPPSGGAIAQATETLLGGVQGATALQAISVSGTDILGWSINRLRQLVSVALPAMTQDDIDNATAGRKSVTGALIAANAGGGAAAAELTQAQVEDETDTTFGLVSGERLAQAVAEFESPGGGGSGGGYGDWTDIGSVTGAISGNPVTVALDTNETIDDYEELYIHIEANDTNDQRVVSHGFRVSDVPTTTLAGGGLGLPFAGNATDEGALLVRRNADGDSLVLDVYGSVINFPATAVTTIYARALTTGGGGGGR